MMKCLKLSNLYHITDSANEEGGVCFKVTEHHLHHQAWHRKSEGVSLLLYNQWTALVAQADNKLAVQW